jgi:hypothetical protein
MIIVPTKIVAVMKTPVPFLAGTTKNDSLIEYK